MKLKTQNGQIKRQKLIITKIISANFPEKKVFCKAKNFYILLAFLLVTMVLLIAVTIYCCFIKY